MYKAEITYVQNGIEYRSTIEEPNQGLFYATVCGSIEGITRAGAHITKLQSMSDPSDKVYA